MSSKFSKEELTIRIKELATEIGFDACGIAQSGIVESSDRSIFTNWIELGYHAEMGYLENYRDKRFDTTLLVPHSKSVISVALNYYPNKFLPESSYQIAWYAYGKDYHDVIKEKLQQLYTAINDIVPIEGRCFCDTAPVLERYWAWKAGLGWIGKNTQLIIPKAGSTFFLGELVIDLELCYDKPMESKCGSCTRCLDLCPTNALIAPKTLNANKCISYLTIENRGEIASEYQTAIGTRIYGCDECLKACPWNRFAKGNTTEEFNMSESLFKMQPKDWESITPEVYQEVFYKSAAKRAKIAGIQRNIKLAAKNKDK